MTKPNPEAELKRLKEKRDALEQEVIALTSTIRYLEEVIAEEQPSIKYMRKKGELV